MPIVSTPPPVFSELTARLIVREYYNIDGHAKSLPCEIGQNFLIEDINSGEKTVLKIANPEESHAALGVQNQVMDLLNNSLTDYVFPRAVKSPQGAAINKINDGYHARLLTFVPGQFLADFRPHSFKMLESFGNLLGRMDLILGSVDIPEAERKWHWDLTHAAELRQYLPDILDSTKRHLADHFFLQFETAVLPRIPELRRQIIQNDGNDYNVLVDPDGRISGLIDFGDMVVSCRIFELAVALAYIMLDKDDPLEACIPVVMGYHNSYPLQEKELDILFTAACTRLASSVTIGACQQKCRPENEYLAISSKPAWNALESLVSINPANAENTFRRACGFKKAAFTGYSRELIIDKRREKLGQMLSVSYIKPLKIIRGAMQYVFDDSGRTFLDCVNNVCHVGHCHPHVARAVRKQIATLNTNTRYLHDNIIRYAEMLTERMPEKLSVFFFVNSGSEANELAIRMMRTHTGRNDMLVLDHAYHGNTNTVIGISPYKFNGPGGAGRPEHIHIAPLPDVYRGKYRGSDSQASEKYAQDASVIVQELTESGRAPAGFIHESVPSVAGQVILPEGYLKKVYEAVRAAGGLCIADEVQVGFGRVGAHFWGFETQDAAPDIVTMGKPIGNGHPLGAVATTREIAESFSNGMEYFNTYGGNPVSCAVGIAVLEVIEREGLQAHARTVGAYFLKRLQELQCRFEIIGDVRGIGLFIGIELVRNRETLEPADRETLEIVEAMKDRGILLSVDGPMHNVIKIKPPMPFNSANADFVTDNFIDVMNKKRPG